MNFKKIITAFILFLSITCQAETIKFLGIPVDGSKKDFEHALILKGFKKGDGDYFVGKFNGYNSLISIQEYKNKVWRVGVIRLTDNGEGFSQSEIIPQYNNLFNQLLGNSKYFILGGKEISQKENISYKMIVENETYQTTFALESEYKVNSITNIVWFRIMRVTNQFAIILCYENLNNSSKGEDL